MYSLIKYPTTVLHLDYLGTFLDPFVGQGEFCVRECSFGYQKVDGECIECNGICPKSEYDL